MDDISDASLQLSGSLSGKACQDLVISSLDMSSELLDKHFECRTLLKQKIKQVRRKNQAHQLDFIQDKIKYYINIWKTELQNILAFRRWRKQHFVKKEIDESQDYLNPSVHPSLNSPRAYRKSRDEIEDSRSTLHDATFQCCSWILQIKLLKV